uniref:ADP dependent glucokinase n=1 Tax=Eptatretus burgeri TaxID=7764 RepID=A0A8C4R5C9_EPTBU
MWTRAVLVAVVAACFVWLFGDKAAELLGDRSVKDVVRNASDEELVAAAWETLIAGPASRASRVAVGVNTCVDVVISGVALLRALGITEGVAQDHDELQSLEELQEAFQHHMGRGAAAERHYSDRDGFIHVAQVASTLPGAKHYVGGNAALIAEKLVKDNNVTVMLSGPVGPKLQQLLDSRIEVPADSHVQQDEFHLILEYRSGEKWGKLETPHASRFIFSHDTANSAMSPLEVFVTSLDSFKPDLVVLSGFHMMEGLGDDMWESRLEEVVQQLNTIPAKVPLHVELASMTQVGFMEAILYQVLPVVASLGLNEQELLFANLAAGGPFPELLSWSGIPDVGIACDIVYWLLETYGFVGDKFRALTRIHFHTLAYHILATVEGRWANGAAAVVAGARAAATQACDALPSQTTGRLKLLAPRSFTPSRLDLHLRERVLTIDPRSPVSVWQRGSVIFYFSPVLVCREPGRTVGLGDAISAEGLLYSQQQ